MVGARITSHSSKVRALVARDFARAFEECDVILAPTTPTASFPLGSMSEDPLTMYL
ncbi:MAG: amidase family protein, partial [Erythrobacter sp.]